MKKAVDSEGAAARNRSGRRVRREARKAAKISKTSQEHSKMRMTISRSSRLAVAFVGALVAPTFAQTRDTIAATATARTHVVKPGDTLWELARLYLSNPWQWQEIFKLNTSLVADPHWIFPGQRLRIPGISAPIDSSTQVIAASPSA